MDVLLHNVQVLRNSVWERVSIGIEEGRFIAIEASLSGKAKREFDGKGAYAFPGGIDLHVHFNEPGRTGWEGFATGSASAMAGGVSFVAEMPLNSIPSTVNVDALSEKLTAIGQKSAVDFGLWGGLVPGNFDDLEPLADAGVIGFKAFMSPSGVDDFKNADIVTLREGMKRIVRTGLRLALHAEDPAVIKLAEGRLDRRETASEWEMARPVESEKAAVRMAIELSAETGCPITIVHVSSPEVLEIISEAKGQGVDILCETCPHYLLMSVEDAESIGSAAKCAPPLRKRDVVDGLRDAVLRGMVDTIGSDHSPCPPNLKRGQSFYKAWGGISGLQHGLPLTLDSLNFSSASIAARLQSLFCECPADTVGLFNKGKIAPGFDADLCLISVSDNRRVIESSELLYRHQHSAYCGRETGVHVFETWLRGRRIFVNGQFVEKVNGRFINFSKLRRE